MTVAEGLISARENPGLDEVSPMFLFREPKSTRPRAPSPTAPASAEADWFEEGMVDQLDCLYRTARRLTKNTALADDLVQDTVVKAMRAREQFEKGTNLKAWLLRILSNTYFTGHRRGGLERQVLDGPEADPLGEGWVSATALRALRDPETQALTPLVEGEVQRALDALPEEYRLAVVLSDVEELSYKEISAAMGCPIGTVMSRLHRGRRMLQKSLREHAVSLGIVAEVEVVEATEPVRELRVA